LKLEYNILKVAGSLQGKAKGVGFRHSEATLELMQ